MLVTRTVLALVMACMPGFSSSSSATQIVSGGSWFSKSSVGTSGGYMMADWRSKVDPITTRIAEKVLANQLKLSEIHLMVLSLILWNFLLTQVY